MSLPVQVCGDDSEAKISLDVLAGEMTPVLNCRIKIKIPLANLLLELFGGGTILKQLHHEGVDEPAIFAEATASVPSSLPTMNNDAGCVADEKLASSFILPESGRSDTRSIVGKWETIPSSRRWAGNKDALGTADKGRTTSPVPSEISKDVGRAFDTLQATSTSHPQAGSNNGGFIADKRQTISLDTATDLNTASSDLARCADAGCTGDRRQTVSLEDFTMAVASPAAKSNSGRCFAEKRQTISLETATDAMVTVPLDPMKIKEARSSGSTRQTLFLDALVTEKQGRTQQTQAKVLDTRTVAGGQVQQQEYSVSDHVGSENVANDLEGRVSDVSGRTDKLCNERSWSSHYFFPRDDGNGSSGRKSDPEQAMDEGCSQTEDHPWNLDVYLQSNIESAVPAVLGPPPGFERIRQPSDD